MSQDPYALHRDALVVDCHNDAIVSGIRRGARLRDGEPRDASHEWGTVRRLRGPIPPEQHWAYGQVSLESLREGGIDCAFFAVDVTLALGNHQAYALDALGHFLDELRELGGEVSLVRSAAEAVENKRRGVLSALAVLENSDALQGSLNALEAFYALGVRSITLTHNPMSLAAAGNAEPGGGGLTRFGRDLVRAMNRLGMLVDVSHIAEAGFWDVLGLSEQPVIASHSCCAALRPHPRNLTDSQLRALASLGGVVGLTFVPQFLTEGVVERPEDLPPLERWIEHLDHAAHVAGIDHVAIGSDFDGGGTLLPSARDYPRITAALAARGYGAEDLRKVLGGNALRVLDAATGGSLLPEGSAPGRAYCHP